MSNNRSLAKFKTDMLNVQNQLRVSVRYRMVAICEEIAENMRAAAPTDEGNLAQSVRVVDITRDSAGSSDIAVKIKGGGRMTTRRSPNGQTYDYAAAIEFGNERSVAQPFFYPTWRRYNAGNSVSRKIAETAKEALAGNKNVVSRRGSPQFGSLGGQGIITGGKGR